MVRRHEGKISRRRKPSRARQQQPAETATVEFAFPESGYTPPENRTDDAGAGGEHMGHENLGGDLDLDALAAEAAGQLAGAGEGAEPSHGVTVTLDVTAFVKAAAMGTAGATAALFKSRDLAPLTVDESELLTRSILDLAAVYGLLDTSKLSPAVAAWFNLGGAIFAIAAPRVIEARDKAAARAADEQPRAA